MLLPVSLAASSSLVAVALEADEVEVDSTRELWSVNVQPWPASVRGWMLRILRRLAVMVCFVW